MDIHEKAYDRALIITMSMAIQKRFPAIENLRITVDDDGFDVSYDKCAHTIEEVDAFLMSIAHCFKLFNKCVSCDRKFSDENTFTNRGWKETQISGLCEKCFDNEFKENEE